MRYMLLIVEPPGQRETRTRAEGEQAYDAMRRFGETLQAEGKLLAVESLATTAKATRVQIRQGQTHLLDGPFAEAKEMVGGFYLLECNSSAEAIEIARRCPAAEWATVEVRPAAPCFEESNA
ncbi:YciI family protein [Ideonella sp. DXS29W]|uniref:YciI family protein n=1 Tax=Ideonella lacteola TaxID=2984193 RepID=A0ABU9BMR6_9BURK